MKLALENILNPFKNHIGTCLTNFLKVLYPGKSKYLLSLIRFWHYHLSEHYCTPRIHRVMKKIYFFLWPNVFFCNESGINGIRLNFNGLIHSCKRIWEQKCRKILFLSNFSTDFPPRFHRWMVHIWDFEIMRWLHRGVSTTGIYL